MNEYIYADNAATTQMDNRALEAMTPYFLELYGNPSQPYSFSRTAKTALKEAREIIANCIGAEPEEIYFTSGGTESDNWALNTIRDGKFAGKGVLISGIEHHAVINPCKKLKSDGVTVGTISPDGDGTISPMRLEHMLLQEPIGLVSIMTANNEIGTIEPIMELCGIAHAHGAVFHTDAVQAVGHIPIDVEGLGVDLLSASAHKFNGPKGVGFLYIRKGLPISPLLLGGSQEQNLRAGTENVAAIVGMAKALKENCLELDFNRKYVSGLENRLLSRLSETGIPFKINGSTEKLPGLVSISFKGEDGEKILHRLDLKRIAVSTGSACDSERTEVSHVLRSIGLEEEYAKGTIRISLGKNNTKEHVDRIVDSLVSIIRK